MAESARLKRIRWGRKWARDPEEIRSEEQRTRWRRDPRQIGWQRCRPRGRTGVRLRCGPTGGDGPGDEEDSVGLAERVGVERVERGWLTGVRGDATGGSLVGAGAHGWGDPAGALGSGSVNCSGIRWLGWRSAGWATVWEARMEKLTHQKQRGERL